MSSDKAYTQKLGGPRSGQLQSDPMPYSMGPSQFLPQFAAATASGYQPRPQTTVQSFKQPPTPNFNTSPQNQQVATALTPAYHTAPYISEFLHPPPAQPIDVNTFKGLKFITLDRFQLETRDIYDEVSGTFQWEMCESQDDRCVSCIRNDCVNKRVFIVSSGSLGRKIVPQIHDLPQVYAIYIYCADVISNQEWANKWSKVRTVCNNDDLYLLPQLAVDVAQSNIEWGTALLKQGKRDDAKKKFDKALSNLNKYIKLSDPVMINEAKSKSEECK